MLDLATGAAGFALYLATLAPDVVGHDGGEFQIVPPLLGIAHPTGYPLYTLLGWAWSHALPLGSMAWRMNLLSAVFGAAAVALVGHVARRLTGHWAAGLLAATLLGVAPAVWEWSIMAGVRSLDLLLQALVLALALGWRQAALAEPALSPAEAGAKGTPAPPEIGGQAAAAACGPEARAPRPALAGGGYLQAGETDPRLKPGAWGLSAPSLWLVALAFALGLALAHHRNSAFLLPGLALFLAWGAPRPRLVRRELAGVALALALPLMTYLYLPLRSAAGAPFDQLQSTGWRDVWVHVLGLSEASDFLDLGSEAAPSRLALVGGEVGRQMTPLGALLALAGTAWLARRDLRVLSLLGVPTLGWLAAEVVWREEGWALEMKFLRAALVPLAVLAGAGAAGLNGGWRVEGGGWRGATGLVLVALLVFGWQGTTLWQEHEERMGGGLDVFRQGLRGGWGPRRLGLTSLPLLEPNALLLADWEQATVFWYLQLIDGLNPEVEVRYPLAGLDRALAEASGRPVYLAAVRPGMKDALAGHPVSGVGSIVRVGPGAVVSEAAPGLRRVLDFGHQIRLLGADFWDERGRQQPTPQVRNGIVGVSLYWQALRSPEGDYSVSVRLVDQEGRVVAQSDLTHPVLRLSPTSGWRAGEVRGDYHELPVGGGGAGPHTLVVILYGREGSGFRNLPVHDAAGVLLGEFAALARVGGGQ